MGGFLSQYAQYPVPGQAAQRALESSQGRNANAPEFVPKRRASRKRSPTGEHQKSVGPRRPPHSSYDPGACDKLGIWGPRDDMRDQFARGMIQTQYRPPVPGNAPRSRANSGGSQRPRSRSTSWSGIEILSSEMRVTKAELVDLKKMKLRASKKK